MDYLIYVVLPYVTIVTFMVGFAWRIRTWWARPRAKAVLFPAARSGAVAVSRLVGDAVLFGKTFSVSKSLWLMAVLFHLGVLLVVLGHIRTVTEFGFLWSLLHLDGAGIESVAFGMGMTAGGLILAGVMLLLVRRLGPTMRVISIFQDYFVLSALLAIILSGIAMRLWMPVHVDEIQHYARGVLTLQPAVEVRNTLFMYHFFLAQILIMYFPFSKLIHLVSKPVAESWTIEVGG
ncbi:MAG: respiratory nitrate reductase subunit gamma [Chloroflexota bacterium]